MTLGDNTDRETIGDDPLSFVMLGRVTSDLRSVFQSISTIENPIRNLLLNLYFHTPVRSVTAHVVLSTLVNTGSTHYPTPLTFPRIKKSNYPISLISTRL